jgi:chromosome segregation ATPase
VENAAQTNVATSAVPSPSLVNTSLTSNSGIAPQQSPSKPALWAAWGVAAARSPSPLTATHTVVNGGVANSSFRVSCEDMALPLPTGPQPAPIPHPANVSTAESPAAAGSEEIEVTKNPDQVQTAKQNSCSSGHAPSSVLQPLVAADAEVSVQLRQALDQISELNVNQRAAQTREMELQRDAAALRAQLHSGLATLQAREAELQGKVVRFAELQSAPQGWKRREAELLALVTAAATAQAASGAPNQLQRVSELEHDMQQLAHDYELQRQDRDAQRELASAARRRLLEVQRSARDDKKAYEEQLRELQREAETLREQLHSRDNVILEATQVELLSAQKDKAALREELQNAEQRVKKSEGQRAAVNARLRKQNAALSSQNAVLVSEKDTLQQRLDRLTAEMQRPAS